MHASYTLVAGKKDKERKAPCLFLYTGLPAKALLEATEPRLMNQLELRKEEWEEMADDKVYKFGRLFILV